MISCSVIIAHRRLLGASGGSKQDFVRPGIRLEAQTSSRFTGTYWNPSKTSTVGVGNTRFGTTAGFDDNIPNKKIVFYVEPVAQVPVIQGTWQEVSRRRKRHLDGEISDVVNGCKWCKWTDRAALDTVKFFR